MQKARGHPRASTVRHVQLSWRWESVVGPSDRPTVRPSCDSPHRQRHVVSAEPKRVGQRHVDLPADRRGAVQLVDRKSTRLNSSHGYISYAVFCLKKKKKTQDTAHTT